MGRGKGRGGPDNQADFERLKRLEEGPPEKIYKGPEFQRGMAGVMTGADDPRSNQPGYMAILFAIFTAMVTLFAIGLCTQQNCESTCRPPLHCRCPFAAVITVPLLQIGSMPIQGRTWVCRP
jgi:hypothetical protein